MAKRPHEKMHLCLENGEGAVPTGFVLTHPARGLQQAKQLRGSKVVLKVLGSFTFLVAYSSSQPDGWKVKAVTI